MGQACILDSYIRVNNNYLTLMIFDMRLYPVIITSLIGKGRYLYKGNQQKFILYILYTQP